MADANQLRKHITTLYALFGLLVVAFVILAVSVWRRSPEAILQEQLRAIHREASKAPPFGAPQYAAIMRLSEQTIADRIAEAKAILLCRHTVGSGHVRCEFVEVLKQEDDFTIPYQVGEPIPNHEVDLEESGQSEEGCITFLTGSSFNPYSTLMIHDGCVSGSRVDPSLPASAPFAHEDFTVEQVRELIQSPGSSVSGRVSESPEEGEWETTLVWSDEIGTGGAESTGTTRSTQWFPIDLPPTTASASHGW